MAIRKNLNPRQMDLQPEMRDILMRNGMQAHIIANGDGYQGSSDKVRGIPTQIYQRYMIDFP